MPTKTKSKSAEQQSRRFIEAAREAGCSEDEVVFDENLKRLTKKKIEPESETSK